MRILVTFVATLMLTACAGLEIKPGEKSHARREIPPGAGVLTGQQGEFTIYRQEEKTPPARGGTKQPK